MISMPHLARAAVEIMEGVGFIVVCAAIAWILAKCGIDELEKHR